MEIIFIPAGLSERLMNEPFSEISSNELDEIKEELNLIDNSLKLQETNLGTDADWIAILAILNGITSVLLIGDKIVKGIDGWISLANRIKKIFSKSDTVYIDKDVATIIAIEFLSKSDKISSLKKISEEIISLKDLSYAFTDRTEKDFIAKPYNVYLQTYEINEETIKILGIRSDGEISELYSFDNLSESIEPF